MLAGNDTMIYCHSGRANNYGKSSQSHEKIVENACERKQIEIFYDAQRWFFFCICVFYIFDGSIRRSGSILFFQLQLSSFFRSVFGRRRQKNEKQITQTFRATCIVQTISWRWCVNRRRWDGGHTTLSRCDGSVCAVLSFDAFGRIDPDAESANCNHKFNSFNKNDFVVSYYRR